MLTFGSGERQRVRFYIYVDVLEELFKAARYREEPGAAILIGQFSVDQDGPFVEVTAFEGLRYLFDKSDDLVEEMAPQVRGLFEEIATQNQSRHIVGLFSSRPGADALLDEATARLHLSLFNMPFQLALVIDGTKDRLGCYARVPGEPFFNASFCLVRASVPGKMERVFPDKTDEILEPDEGLI